MASIRRCLLNGTVAVCLTAALSAQEIPAPAGTSISEALFELREFERHLHSRMERPIGIKEWLDLAVADGPKVVVMLDHPDYRLFHSNEQQQLAAAQRGSSI
jgi:hypothetical protein